MTDAELTVEAAAQVALLRALARGDGLPLVEAEVRGCARKGFTPDLAALRVGVAAMNAAGVTAERPLDSADLLARHLPELVFRNQRALRERTVYAVQAVAALRGGLVPDVLDDTYWWQTRDIVQYAVAAAVAYVRASAEHTGQSVAQFVPLVAERLRVAL